MPRSGNIYYSVYPELGDALPTVVLIHGAGGAGDQWPYRLRRIRGYRVFALDLPGHGRSLGLPERSIESYADRLLEWMQLAQISGVSLIGHSMGSAVALVMAAKAPNLIDQVILLGAAMKFPVNPGLLEKLRIPLRAQEAMNMIVKWSFAKGSDMRLRPAYFKQLAANRDGGLLKDFEACAVFDATDWLAEVRQPATLISGEEDQMVPARLSKELAASMRQASSHVVRAAGHMLMQENPAETARFVEAALQNR